MELRNIRNIVIAEINRRKMTRHALAKLLNGKVSRTVVYDWIRGDCDITARKLAEILDALKIKL